MLMTKLNLESVGQRILSVKVARTVRTSGQRVVALRRERNYTRSLMESNFTLCVNTQSYI